MQKFQKLILRFVSEVIKYFLRELNGSVCYKYIKEELNQTISLETVEKIYNEIRDVIAKYYNVVYQSEVLGPRDAHKNYSVDESFLSQKIQDNKYGSWVS